MKRLFILFALMLTFSAFANVEFDYDSRKIIFEEDTLKFFEKSIVLDKTEVSQIFPDYEIVLISDFDKNRKFKINKKFFEPKKVLLLNDTTRTFHGFNIFPISSRSEYKEFKNGEIKSLITIYGRKNVRLKHSGGDEFEIVVK